MPAKPILGPGLVARPLRVHRRDVVYVRGILEASEGLAVMFAERGGDLILAAPESREAALEEIVIDLKSELCPAEASAAVSAGRPAPVAGRQ